MIENNGWAYSTPVGRQVPLKDLADRAKAYGIASYIVDGNDVVAVYETAKRAVDLCRAGDGPVIIESKTMRMRGHAQHDPAEYVPKEMFEYWKQRDPLDLYEKYLNENKLWDAKQRKEIESRIDRELTEDLEYAENSPFPPPELSEQGVYCEDGCHTIEANWKRSKSELMPPKSGVAPVWKVEGFGIGEAGARRGGSAPASARGNGAKAPAAVKSANSGKKTGAKKVAARKGRS